MKSDTMTAEEKQAKVLEFVKSAEFQKCPNEQIIEFSVILRVQFRPLSLCSGAGAFWLPFPRMASCARFLKSLCRSRDGTGLGGLGGKGDFR